MPMLTKVSGAWKYVKTPYYNLSGVWKTVALGWVKVAGTWKIFFAALGSTISPSSISTSGDATMPVYSGIAGTAAGFEGIPPYSYAWEYVSGDAGVLPVSPAAGSTYFYHGASSPDTYTADWRCKITDAVGNVTYTDSITIEFTLI